jgi:hypothetical protein
MAAGSAHRPERGRAGPPGTGAGWWCLAAARPRGRRRRRRSREAPSRGCAARKGRGSTARNRGDAGSVMTRPSRSTPGISIQEQSTITAVGGRAPPRRKPMHPSRLRSRVAASAPHAPAPPAASRRRSSSRPVTSSISAWVTQFRNVSGLILTRSPIRGSAPVRVAGSRRRRPPAGPPAPEARRCTSWVPP